MHMFKTVMLIAAVGLVGSASPLAQADESPRLGAEAHPLMSGEHMAKIREEARLHEQRAHELEPIIARDRQARHDVETDWVVLERHARDLHGRAVDFRAYASESSGRGQYDLNQLAGELEQFAAHDEENAHLQHEIADRLDRAIQSATMMRDWHLKIAQRLRDWLAANGA
jgi:hypothetical protein